MGAGAERQTPQSDTAACREVQVFIDENVPPPDYLKRANQRQEGAAHIARLVFHERPIPKRHGDALLDLETAHQIMRMLGETSVVPIRDRLDRALAWAADPETTIEAALFLGYQIVVLDPAKLDPRQAAAVSDMATGSGYRAFLARHSPNGNQNEYPSPVVSEETLLD